MGRWTNAVADTGEVHTIPVDDMIEHEPVDCPCGPVTEPIPRDDGSMGWHVSHFSLDGREANEGCA